MFDILPPTVRPVPRWVRVWAALTTTVALLLLFVLGGFVTSFRVGMADPVWPTEPWYLADKDWKQLEFGFLVEHTHRAAGWVVGAMTVVLALGAWLSEPNPRLRWLGLAALLGLVVAYGWFHGQMRVIETGLRANPGRSVTSLPFPVPAGVACLAGVALSFAACAAAVAGGAPGRWARSVAVVALVAVMIQGLLGGFRVFLNQLYGPVLAAYHGTFAQVVFSVLASVVFLAAPRSPGDALPPPERHRLRGVALLLPAAVFVQLVWGVWLRHMGSPVAQRLHVLTAFVVTGLVVAVVARALATPDGRAQLRGRSLHLLAIVALQILLGVEGWMAKYAGTVDPATGVMAPPRMAAKDKEVQSAAVRTGHVVIGTALMASAVVFALRVWRPPLGREDDTALIIPRLTDSLAQFGVPDARG